MRLQKMPTVVLAKDHKPTRLVPMSLTIARRSKTTNTAAATRAMCSTSRSKPASIYVLELTGGFVYVGKSSNVTRRIQQHKLGKGAMFTKRHPPTGRQLDRLGKLQGEV
jgi:hypothetical protein